MDPLLGSIMQSFLQIIAEERRKSGREHLKAMSSEAFFAMNIEDFELFVENNGAMFQERKGSWTEMVHEHENIEFVIREIIGEVYVDAKADSE